MGSGKCWDLFQEYPGVFAGLMPASALFPVRKTFYGDEVDPGRINQTVPYTIYNLAAALRELFGPTGYSLTVNAEECWIKIFVTSDRYGATSLLHDLIYSYVPAHLYVYSNQQVSNHTNSDAYMADRMSRTFEQVVGTGGN